MTVAMDMAVGALFVKKHFNEDSKARAYEMIGDLKASFLELLEQSDWMDPDTKATARHKVIDLIL